MQQEPNVVLNQPQGRVVGNRIIYNDSILNCNYCVCDNLRGKIVLAAITLLYFFATIFGFAFGGTLLGVAFLFFFLACVLICIWNFYRLRTQNQTQQAMMQNLSYNQVPPHQVPGPYQPTTYPLLHHPQPQEYPPQNYPPHNYPSQPPCAVPYVPQNHPPQLLPQKVKSSKATADQETQPLTQEEPEVPSTTDADSSHSVELPPPSYDATVKDSKENEKTDK